MGDIHGGNHTSVWGSFWHEGEWGFKCCYSFLKQSYCTGATGRENFQSVLAEAAKIAEAKEPAKEETPPDKKHKKKKKKKDKKKEEEEEDFETQVAKAMKKLDKEDKVADASKDDRKRGYNSLGAEAGPPRLQQRQRWRPTTESASEQTTPWPSSCETVCTTSLIKIKIHECICLILTSVLQGFLPTIIYYQ